MTTKLNVSLEPHLKDVLTLLLRVLPEHIIQQLTPHLSPEATTNVVPVIPYELLLQISRWCQTPDGNTALQTHSPPLDSRSYTIVSLLAGTRTSPEKHFPPYTAPDPEEAQRLRTKERKAIATLVNAVLSVVCTGGAIWWASQHAGMQLEWRALVAVGAALVVALAEIVLYMIWDARQTPPSRRPTRRYVVVRPKEAAEKDSDVDVVPHASSTAVDEVNLRHRTTMSLVE